MKIVIAQITSDPGDIQGNTKKIINTLSRTKKSKVDLVVFPELSIPGYSSMDLFLRPGYLKANKQALAKIIRATRGIATIVGFVDFKEKNLGPDDTPQRLNAAAVIDNGKLVGVVHKTLLPTYDVFDEGRYFQSGNGRKVIKVRGKKLGIEICEDAWDKNYPVKVSKELVSQGAQILVNISASPFYVDKRIMRQKLVGAHARKYRVPFVYANLVGSQDGYEGELVFDGQSMAFDRQGQLIALGKAFEEDLVTVDFDNDNPPLIPYFYPPVAQLFDALVFGIRGYFKRTAQTKAWVGLSGGIDSAVVVALAAEALGAKNITGISMPSRFSSQGSKDDARLLAKKLGINFLTIPIEKTFASYLKMMRPVFKNLPFNTTEENIQARIRGNILMALSNKFGGLVISTGNKTEMAVGYCTLYGDMSGGLAAIADVPKIQVYELAQYINNKNGKEIIPRAIIDKAPSAELREKQTDESSLGIEYAILSPLVEEIIAGNGEVSSLNGRYPKDIIKKVAVMIDKAEYKRRQAPPGIKVQKKTFGVGRRIPL